MYGVCQAVCEQLLHAIWHYTTSPQQRKEASRTAGTVLSWLEDICKQLGDVGKWAIGKIFYTHFRSFPSPFMVDGKPATQEGCLLLSLFLADELIPIKLQEQLHRFYFTLLGEPDFKENFASCFISKGLLFSFDAGGDHSWRGVDRALSSAGGLVREESLDVIRCADLFNAFISSVVYQISFHAQDGYSLDYRVGGVHDA